MAAEPRALRNTRARLRRGSSRQAPLDSSVEHLQLQRIEGYQVDAFLLQFCVEGWRFAANDCDGVGDDVEFRTDSYQRGDLAVDARFGVHAVHHDVVVGAQDESQDGAQVRVVGQLFELLSSKNDLAVMVEDFLNF